VERDPLEHGSSWIAIDFWKRAPTLCGWVVILEYVLVPEDAMKTCNWSRPERERGARKVVQSRRMNLNRFHAFYAPRTVLSLIVHFRIFFDDRIKPLRNTFGDRYR
jgi:hypothetical protein